MEAGVVARLEQVAQLMDHDMLDTPRGQQKQVGREADGAVLEARMYSSRMMDRAILNRLRVTDTTEDVKPPSEPVIGMDGKTEDGAVPYQILRNQLEFLK